jgi:hypothetical protein
MNKKLLLALYDRSGLGAYMPVDYKGQELEVEEHWEKFAQLIVKECVDICQDTDGEEDAMALCGRQDCAVEIKEHFGVDE